MSRHTCPTKPSLKNQLISVIIPVAGEPRKKSYKRGKYSGHPSFYPITNNTTLIEHQVEIVKSILPNSEIILVGGFEIEKLLWGKIPKEIRLVENQKYYETSVVNTIRLGLINTNSKSVLIFYGNLFFGADILSNIKPQESSVIAEPINNIADVGINIINEEAIQFAYGLPARWTQIFYLTGNTLQEFRKECFITENNKMFTHEILNKIINKNSIKVSIFKENSVIDVEDV